MLYGKWQAMGRLEMAEMACVLSTTSFDCMYFCIRHESRQTSLQVSENHTAIYSGEVVYFIVHRSREASQMIVDIGKIEVHVFIEVALFERETCFHINKNYKQSNNSLVFILRLNTFFFIQGNIVPRTTIYRIACAFIDDYACSVRNTRKRTIAPDIVSK